MILNGDEHESALTEWRGKFRVICGCGWTSDYGSHRDVDHDYRIHLQAVERGEEIEADVRTDLDGRAIPKAVLTIRKSIYNHHGPGRCYVWRQTHAAENGVLAYDVCGLQRGHDGLHQAGWTGTGEFFGA